jgi:thioredoxin reductase (NADPH)
MLETDVLIIGAGPVGLFAVFQAGTLGMKAIVVDSLDMVGGQCRALYPEKPIYDIPACPEISAEDLIRNLERQIAQFKPEFLLKQTVVSLKQEDNIFYSETSNGIKIKSKIVIIAAGAGSFIPNRPPLENLESYENKSVFYMVQNRNQFLGKKIAIAGGGDSAIDWAINLSDIAEKIYLIHRRDKFRAQDASLIKVAELTKAGKIELSSAIPT